MRASAGPDPGASPRKVYTLSDGGQHDHPFRKGQKVERRDGTDPWKEGYVTKLHPLEVRNACPPPVSPRAAPPLPWWGGRAHG